MRLASRQAIGNTPLFGCTKIKRATLFRRGADGFEVDSSDHGRIHGIGRACALDLNERGFTVFGAVRKTSDADLHKASGGRVRPVILDVADYESVRRAADEIAEQLQGRGLDGLVNNAGISVAGPLECLPMADFDRQLRVNVSGQVAVTQAFLPLLRRARGRVVFMSSESGRVTLPGLGAYAASKHALEAVADAFRRELRSSGVLVSIVEPGSIKTPIWEKASSASEAVRRHRPSWSYTALCCTQLPA